ncbi:Tn3 family transposase [Cryobacterium sp. CG_9.6]|uniref:Tn3 family transposase n=1 Tax=Cryobacterium sp. CG_9.6 TaxID=2760710 RepID=UPI002473CBED|nr:Tn3 family transposase [Cryobacterium sp. CG_9.6]MDH6238571.1 TnpA family transposase [Cryobacterium sp. CG_9.6]
MPVSFVSTGQQERYARYSADPDQGQLDRFFHLSARDRALIAGRRGAHNRLGFAAQIGTVRFLGVFLPNPAEVPRVVAEYLAGQLEIPDWRVLHDYARREGTNRLHAGEIQSAYGYRDFAAEDSQAGFTGWLQARVKIGAERPTVLFDLATAWLLEAKILLPRPSTLLRAIAQAREQSNVRVWDELASLPNRVQQARLEELLVTRTGERSSVLDRLRRAPTRVSASGLLGALERLDSIRAIGVGNVDVSPIPPSRVAALARYGVVAKAQTLARMTKPRRIATLLAAAQQLEIAATDDALDLLDQLLGSLLSRAEKAGKNERARSQPAVDSAAWALSQAVQVLLDPPEGDVLALWAAITQHVSRNDLEAAVATLAQINVDPADVHLNDLMTRYTSVRRFLPALLRTLQLRAAPGGEATLEAFDALRRLEGRHNIRVDAVSIDLATGVWRHRIEDENGFLNRRAYTFLVLEKLRESLRRRDVFVPGSDRWGDPRAKLLEGVAWETARPQIAAGYGHSLDADQQITTLAAELDDAYRAVASRLHDNPAVRIESIDGRARPVLTPLDRLEEPASLAALRDAVNARIPRVDLPDQILEVAGWTRFPGEFTHVSEGNTSAQNLHLSICAVLLAEACNVGLEPVVHPDNPALTRARLSWTDQNYIRTETIAAANARLVEMQSTIPITAFWGGGDVASADGIRFVVPVRTLNAGPNPRYFGAGRGITYLNFLSDQFSGFHGIVIPGTLRDSLYILDGLLEQQTGLQPTELMTDTAGYSDQVFGLFRLNGYQFSPRLADIGGTRFWRINRDADYGPLNDLATHRINTALIATHWDDLLRIAGSLATGTVKASELLRVLQGQGRPTPLGRALAEYGRIAKTTYLLAYLDDDSYRRRILTQLNRTESRHALARDVFHGQRGQLRQRYREGQEDQLGALGLVVNAIVLWNTRYIDAVVNQLRAEGYPVNDTDVARLSPLIRDHINLLGRYRFSTSDLPKEGLRPLRNPNTPH